MDKIPRNHDPQLQRAMEDLSIIRSTMERQERLFPGRFWMFLVGSAVVTLASTITWFHPQTRIDRWFAIVWIWLPLLIGTATVILAAFALLQRRGHLVLGTYAKEVSFMRFIIGPGTLTLGFIAIQAGYYPPAVALLCIAVVSSMISMIMPRIVRLIPSTFLIIAWLELGLGVNTDWVGLANGILLASGLAFAAFTVRREHQHKDPGERQSPGV